MSNFSIKINNNLMYLTLSIFVYLLFFFQPAFVNADHVPNPCSEPPSSKSSTTFTSTPGGVGLFVPVKDSKTHALLGDIKSMLKAIEKDSTKIENESRKIKFYLRKLCEKEYEEDHILQHAWAGLIGEFVEQTQIFVTRGYGAGNPVFITNQNVYYQLVDLATIRVFLQDIADSNIGDKAKATIIKSITSELFDTKFPYDPGMTGVQLAPDDLPADISADYYSSYDGEIGDDKMARLLFDASQNEGGLTGIAGSDLEERLVSQREFEKEKLAWGRGFFSYELCDLAVYNNNDEDRRNCRISTPGALIQDQVSFVFGSALRQMELNDEYEEWVAPNTFAVLSDILSKRTLNDEGDGDSRGPFGSIPQTPKSPGWFENENKSSGFNESIASQSDWEPIEFSGANIDFQLNKDLNAVGLKGAQEAFFTDFLNADCFLKTPAPPSC